MTERMTAEERLRSSSTSADRISDCEVVRLDYALECLHDAEREAKAEAWREWQKWIDHVRPIGVSVNGCRTYVGLSCNCGLDDERERRERECRCGFGIWLACPLHPKSGDDAMPGPS